VRWDSRSGRWLNDDPSDAASGFDAQPAGGSAVAWTSPVHTSDSRIVPASTEVGTGQVAADGSSQSPTIEPSVIAITGSGPAIFDGSADASGFSFLDSTFSPNGASPQQVKLALNAAGLNVTGAGITVGVISDSFNNLGGAAQDEANGALPPAAKVHVLKDLGSGGTDEGRAMMQVVHDLVSDATLDFYTADVSEQDFANGIIALANAGAKVIVDDVSYFDEPFFQTGVIANAIHTVEQEGVTYLTSAGNDAATAFQAAWTAISGTFDGVSLTDAESFGGSLVQTVTLGANSSVSVPFLFEWNLPYGSAQVDDIEVHVFSGGQSLGVVTNVTSNPWIGFSLPGGATYQIAIVNPFGADPGLIKEIVSGNGLPVTVSGANTGTVFGHHMSPDAITVGAVDSANAPAFGVTLQNEKFSSSGLGTELLFNFNGTAVSPAQNLSPIAISGIDDIRTTVSGGLGDFFGTSAAAPSVAGVVADMLQANPNLTPSQIKTLLEQSATSFGDPSVAGAGLVNAAKAVQLAQQLLGTISIVATRAEAVQGGAAIGLLSGAPVITDAAATLTSATVRIANGSGAAVAGDKLFVAGVQSGTVGGLTVSWNATTSTLTLSGSASIATYQTVLSQVTYQDAGTDASSGAHPVRTVTWSVNDGTQTLSATSQVTVDRAPTVTNASGFAVAGTTLSVAAANGALSGDSDLDHDALAVASVNGIAVAAGGTAVAGSFGHLTLNPDGSYGYVANGGVAAGSQDSFNLVVGDGNGGSAATTLKVTIDSALVTAPLAILTPTGKATPATWTLTGSGGNGSLTFGLAQAALHGTAAVNANGTFTYTPAAGYSGSDSFQYRVTDGLGETSLNTVSVGVGSAGYQVAQSLRLTGSAGQYLSQTPTTGGNQTTWTWSSWVNVSSMTSLEDLFSAVTPDSSSWTTLRFANGQLEFFDDNGSYVSHLVTTQQFSTNTWYQVTLAYDTTQAVAANRIKLFVNGQQVTSFATQVDPSQNYAGVMGSTAPRYLGFDARWPTLNEALTGNLADAQFIEGQALGPAALGTLVNGQWEPIAYTGSYGTNGYHLTFASGGVGADVSGNGDNFTPVNLSNANVSSASPGGTGVQVALTLDNGVAFNNGSSDAISGASVRLTGGFANDGDLLSADTSGTGITASWNAANETLTLSGTDTAAHYQALLDNLVFSSGASDPTNGGANTTRTATWQVTDATSNQLSAPQSETIDISPSYPATAGLLAFDNTASQEAGAVTIADGSSVELVYSAAAISFIGSSGTLQAENSAGFTGQIAGFSGQDQIDLRDVVFSPQTTVRYAAEPANTDGRLTVGEDGQTANLALLGNYAETQFAVSGDGYGGTLVTLQPAPSTRDISLATPQKHP
jgi:hypothetical protein